MKPFCILLLVGILSVSACQSLNGDVEPRIQEGEIVFVETLFDLDLSQDTFSVNEIKISGDKVVFEVQFTGGCADHIFTLYVLQEPLDESPPVVQSVLEHQSNGDTCENEIVQDVSFDIRVVRDLVRSRNPQEDSFRLHAFNAWSTFDFGTVDVAL